MSMPHTTRKEAGKVNKNSRKEEKIIYWGI
jgi:hypothetical protein